MTISFFPLGIAFTSSFAISSSITNATTVAGFPATASRAEYAVQLAGPQGPAFKTASGSKVTLINL